MKDLTDKTIPTITDEGKSSELSGLNLSSLLCCKYSETINLCKK